MSKEAVRDKALRQIDKIIRDGEIALVEMQLHLDSADMPSKRQQVLALVGQESQLLRDARIRRRQLELLA